MQNLLQLPSSVSTPEDVRLSHDGQVLAVITKSAVNNVMSDGAKKDAYQLNLLNLDKYCIERLANYDVNQQSFAFHPQQPVIAVGHNQRITLFNFQTA